MILRRVIEHLRKQAWTAIGIDFVIVVIGVFIGIQLGNMNQAHADKRLGREYVVRLTRDLNSNLGDIRAQVAYYTSVLDAVKRTDDLLRARNPDARALVINAYRATEIIYAAPARATYDEIVSSGHLDLLPMGAAESGLSQYYAFDGAQDVYRMGLNSDYRQVVRKIIPMRMQIAIRDGCSDVRDETGGIVGFTEECELDVEDAELRRVAAALRAAPAVAAELRYQYSFAVSAVLNLGGIKTNLEQTIAALGQTP